MCKAPNILPDGQQVACRECSLCQDRAKNDWIGRNIAESKTAKFSYVLTLTYGRGRVGEVLHERAVILTYSDVQKFLKLLRRHGVKCRYFVTGEYGGERGRAHWNVILYSDEPIPQLAGWDQYGRWTAKAYYKQRFNWVRVDDRGNPVYLQDGSPAYWWPHGFIHVDVVNLPSVRYVCKYVLKDLDSNGKQGHKGQSLKPPLGTKYFEQLAEKYVAQGLAPQSPEYRFPEVKRRNGDVIPFWLKDRPLEMFLDHYMASWERQRGKQPRPKSDLVDRYEGWGRVVWDEAKATEHATRHITTHKLVADHRPPRQEYDGSLWAPLMRNRAWWEEYFRGFGDGEEQQRQIEDVKCHEEYVYYYEQCVANGAVEPKGWRIYYGEICRALANYRGFQSVDDWQRSRQGERVDTELHFEHDHRLGLGKVGRWNRDHAKQSRPGTGGET